MKQTIKCPKCKSLNVVVTKLTTEPYKINSYYCKNCGYSGNSEE